MKNILVLLIFTLIQLNTFAQVGINTDSSTPDASAILDVKSTDKGMLVPRMTTGQRTSISSPATGLLVFDETTTSFWFYEGAAWTELAAGNIKELADADNDTKIQVEEGNDDDDLIRFDIAGTENFRFSRGRIRFANSGASVIIGQEAGANDDFSSNENTYIGYYTGNDNVSSAGNVAIGRASQEAHISGNFTTSIGNYSMQKHETGTNNVALGAYALGNSIDGASNTALGTGALRYDTTGNNNVALGAFALYNGKNVATTVAIGANAGYSATGDNNVFLGYNAGYSETGSNKLFIDNSNTSSPLVYGEFNNNLIRINGDFNSTGEITGNTTMDIASTALVGNIAVGAESTDQGTSNHTGDGFTTTPWLYTNAIEAQGERGSASTLITIGNDGTHGGDDEIHFVTSGESQMKVASNGRVGLNKGTPTSDFHIRQSQQSITNGTGGITFEESANIDDYWRMYHSGIYFSFNLLDNRVAYVNTTGAWTVSSDATLKKNINPLSAVLDRVLQLRPVSYHYKRQKDSEQLITGFIAQEVQPLFPEMVVDGEDGKLGMTYATAGIIAIKAIQEQQAIIQEQNNEIETLKKQNAAFEERLKKIEAKMK